MTIAVTTPTGNVGSHVVRMLCQAGVRPRLLLRNPDRLDAQTRDHVDVAVGDQRDTDYVAEATRDVEAIFWVHPEDFSLPDPVVDAERTGEGLAAAMRRNRLARVVFQSSVGAEMRHGMGFVDGMARIEQRLDTARDETGAALLHLRCGYFMTNLLMDLDGLRAGRLTTIRPLDEPMPWVDPHDIVTVATLRLLADDWTGRQVQAVHGPADLTWTEAATTRSQYHARGGVAGPLRPHPHGVGRGPLSRTLRHLMTRGSAADAELPRTEAIVRLVKYRNGERTSVGALRADRTVVATPWSRLEELFAEPDPRRAVAGPVFLPYLWSAIIGPGQDIVIPTADTLTDYEVELAVVIGRTARSLTEADAMDAVFGWTTTANMTWRVPQLLAITRTITLHAGDIITTGTPGGVGYFRDPPEFLQPGDTITAQIDQIGALTNPVVRGW